MAQSTTETAGRPAALHARDARKLLLDAATELFAVHGVAGTTLVMIAKRAGFTPAMLHYYFKGRDQLLDAVVEERFAQFIAQVWDPVQPDEEPSVTMQGLVERLLDGIEKMPWIPQVWVREVLNESGLLRERVQCRLPYKKIELLAGAIARRQGAGASNPDLDPLLVVSSAIGLVMLHTATMKVWSEKFHREPLARQALRRHITGLLLEGLCGKGAKFKSTVKK